MPPSLNSRRMTMEDETAIPPPPKRTPWNKGKLIGAKPPLLARHAGGKGRLISIGPEDVARGWRHDGLWSGRCCNLSPHGLLRGQDCEKPIDRRRAADDHI